MSLLLLLFQPTSEPCTASSMGQVYVATVTIIGFVVNALIGEWRQTRKQRRDDDRATQIAMKVTEEAATVREKVVDEAAVVKRELGDRASSVERNMLTRTEDIATKLDENTEVSRNAFHESNSANQKIATMEENFTKLLKRQQAGERREDARG